MKKGPELKLSGLKVPDFLLDVYYDLKDRHLLPLAAILLVAIVVVPIALTQSPGSEEEAEVPTPATSSAVIAASGITGHHEELVATSTPGLRKYQRRLKDLKSKDPFKQQFAEEEAESEEAGTGSSEAAGGGESAPETTTSAEETGGLNSTPGPGNLVYYSYAIDATVKVGGQGVEPSDAKPTLRKNLPELTMLPSRETPAVIYMGSSKDGKKALMLVSSDVTSIFGDGKCVLGSQTCELLAMEPGVPETFVYGTTGRTYKIEIRQIHLVETTKLNRAPLGKPQKKQSKPSAG